MQHSTKPKRESGQPASSPQKKAKAPAPGNQMPAPSGSSTRNHLGGDVPVSISSSSKPKDPKPDDNSDEDETDPQAGPSSGPPILPVDDDDDDDDDDEQQDQNEGNNDEKSDTLEYNSAPEGITDSDDTVDYQDLVVNDDASWSLLTQEQKICPILDNLVFQDTLITHQLMSCTSVPRTSMKTNVGSTVVKRMCAETTPISRRFMIK